ncbi:hypothetical protein ACMHYO_11685 [Allopusillimonas ginsengisoli]|uniref:hypothetical protein n=1 Tax=Allopusillimonas ginsengisoli TaxID=453575 RepID=UPI0039C3668B
MRLPRSRHPFATLQIALGVFGVFGGLYARSSLVVAIGALALYLHILHCLQQHFALFPGMRLAAVIPSGSHPAVFVVGSAAGFVGIASGVAVAVACGIGIWVVLLSEIVAALPSGEGS